MVVNAEPLTTLLKIGSLRRHSGSKTTGTIDRRANGVLQIGLTVCG